jgi:hypothetical protein
MGTTECITPQESLHRQAVAKSKQLLSGFGIKEGLVAKDVEARHKRAVEYVVDNPEVQGALRDLIATRGSGALYGPEAQKLASITLNIKAALDEGKEFKSGKYYEGTLHLTNQISSILLDALPTKAPADVLNVSGAVATAYVYGFFWGK